ncbi:androgen-induced gene 1 protein-like [Maniola hyperantus]|uniref:androgen-induced gene 1 protein-like n=1 Tax=Aphantopus hyperantus TaxID=2795564 RepID=UPI001569C0C4|nr:androgen-induced gene 1 protein-like [Maniola hyperantus]XP_034834441.1 androgen-induced gene 1 protein-like [Maniola hyperantus]
MLKVWFHLIGAIQFFYGCYYDYTYVKIPSTSTTFTEFGGKFKYLTYLNAMLQTVYFTVALINDLFGTNESSPSNKPLVRRTKDVLFSALAFPLALFVGVSFWGIYAVDRELILPKMMDAYFPTWLNHVMHSNIVVFTIIEMATSFRMYPKRKFGLSILTTFMLFYVVWIHVIYFKSGSWVYPILSVLNWPLRVFFYLFSLGFVCGLYTLGESMNQSVWSKEVEATVRSEKKKAK